MGMHDGPTTRQGARRRDRGDVAVVALSLYLAAFIAWVVLRPGSAETRAILSDWAFVPMGAVAAIAWFASTHPGLDARDRRAWRFLAAAFLLTWAGDMTWLFLEVVRHVDPFPSAADSAYLAFYPVVLAGLLSFGVNARSRADRLTLGLDTGIVLLGGFMVVWYLVLGPTVRASSSSGLEKALAVAYPVGDLLLIFGVTAIVLRRDARRSGRALRLLVGAMGLFLVADVSYGWLNLRDAYNGGDWPDAFWMAAQVLFAVAAQQQRRTATVELEGRRDVVAPLSISRLPYVAVGVSYALLLLVARGQAAYPLGGLLFGAVVLTSLVVGRQVTALRENVQLMNDFHRLAVTDSLTGLDNRRHFFEVAEMEFGRSRRTGRPLAALMIDIDHFKTINDSHGHATGDAVLMTVADAARKSLRGHDLLARYGGDEFVALLPDTDLDAAMTAAIRLRDAVVTAAGAPVPVTLSLGIATSEGCIDLNSVLQRADTALYAAKQSGRDCVRAFVAPVPVAQ